MKARSAETTVETAVTTVQAAILIDKFDSSRRDGRLNQDGHLDGRSYGRPDGRPDGRRDGRLHDRLDDRPIINCIHGQD